MLHRLAQAATVVLALALMVAAAVAQDKPAAADSKQPPSAAGVEAKTLLQNEQVRVIEMRFKPGAKTSSVSHPNRFVYALTDGALVFSPPGKTPYELSFRRGEALWVPADETTTQNDTDKEVRTLVVEIEGRAAAASGRESKGRRGGGRRHGRKAARKGTGQ